jgi:2-alkyl-3-oxoalkanoate reductase
MTIPMTTPGPSPRPMTVLVTGGGGFLGGAIVRRLHARGDRVRSYTRSANPWLAELNIEQVHGDLADSEAVSLAAVGCDAIIHTAAKAGVWGRWDDYHRTNVLGTESVIAACRAQAISRLVYTSTPSVVHTGRDIEAGTESLPIASHFLAHYPATKARAEAKVLAANGPDLATVALRPHLIWGPGDPHLIPRLLARARAGKLRRIGRRDPVMDLTYIDNAARAHIDALDRLAVGSSCAGRAYFITNGEPVKIWEFLNAVLTAAKLPIVTRSVPVTVASLAGRISEWLFRIFRIAGEPAMTRFVASQMSSSHWFDITAARQDLGYSPTVSMAEGLSRLTATFAAESSAPSKTSSRLTL